MTSRISFPIRMIGTLPMRMVGLAFLVRLVLYGVVWFTTRVLPPDWIHTESSATVGAWTRWDDGHYVAIATHGYAALETGESAACFPLYPLLIRIVHTVTGLPPGVSGMILSFAFFLALIVVLAALAERVLGAERAEIAMILFLVTPFAVIFYRRLHGIAFHSPRDHSHHGGPRGEVEIGCDHHCARDGDATDRPCPYPHVALAGMEKAGQFARFGPPRTHISGGIDRIHALPVAQTRQSIGVCRGATQLGWLV